MSRHTLRKPEPDHIDELLAGLPALLSVSQVAAELQLSIRQVRRLIEQRRIRSHKMTPGDQGFVRVPRTALAEFLRKTAA